MTTAKFFCIGRPNLMRRPWRELGREGDRRHPQALLPEASMGGKNRLEPMADGFVGFYTESGEHWKHKDIGDAHAGPGYRLFISDKGEERRYTFGPKESHDATIFDLRQQLAATEPMTPAGRG
jgi:hypothetical protein